MNRKVDTAYFLNDPRKFDSVEQAEKELNRLRAVCIRLPQCVLGHTSLQGEAGGKDAQGDPRPGKQKSGPGESQSRGGATALYEAERGGQEGGGWH